MMVGYKLKKVREDKRISQQELADYLNISQKTYSNFESCKSTPSLKQLCTLSIKLEFDLVEYLKELGIKFNTSSQELPEILFTEKNENIKLLEHRISNYKLLLNSKDDIIELLKQKIEWIERQR